MVTCPLTFRRVEDGGIRTRDSPSHRHPRTIVMNWVFSRDVECYSRSALTRLSYASKINSIEAVAGREMKCPPTNTQLESWCRTRQDFNPVIQPVWRVIEALYRPRMHWISYATAIMRQ